MKLHGSVRVLVVCRWVACDDLDVDLRFLSTFTNRCLFGGFVGVYLSAREFPVAGQGNIGGAQADQEMILVFNDCHSDWCWLMHRQVIFVVAGPSPKSAVPGLQCARFAVCPVCSVPGLQCARLRRTGRISFLAVDRVTGRGIP